MMRKEKLTITDKNYHESMVAIYDLMNKGEDNLTEPDVEKLKEMAVAAERCENEILKLKPSAYFFK